MRRWLLCDGRAAGNAHPTLACLRHLKLIYAAAAAAEAQIREPAPNLWTSRAQIIPFQVARLATYT